MSVPWLCAQSGSRLLSRPPGVDVLGSALALAMRWPLAARAAVPPELVEPCPVVLEGVDTTNWQLVETLEFTFCVPENWKLSGARASFAGGSVQWKSGRAPSHKVALTVGERVPPEALVPVETFGENVAGHRAEFWRQRLRSNFRTGATWTSPSIYFTGEANSRDLAATLFTVYRTVRFAD